MSNEDIDSRFLGTHEDMTIERPVGHSMRLAKDDGRKPKRARRVEMTHDTPAVKHAEASLSKKLAADLKAIAKQVAQKLKHKAHAATKFAEEEEDERRALDSADWRPLVDTVAAELETVARDGAERALEELDIDDPDITDQVFEEAADWARERAAELVGKKWNGDGELVDNADADMAITDTLRDELRAAVTEAIEGGDSAADLAERIEGIAGFSEERAMSTARTEIIRSNAQGQMTAMRQSGVVERKAWSTAGEEACEDCEGNEDAGDIALEDDFPTGDDAPPAHPACRCVVIAVVGESDEDDEGSDDEGDNSETEDEE